MVAKLKVIHDLNDTDTLSEKIMPYIANIAERAKETELGRMVPAENIELIRKAGFVRAMIPKSLGGDERSLKDYCDGIRTISKACPSTGWVTGVLNIHQPAVTHFHESVQKRVWKDSLDTIICSSGSPIMKAKLVEGGILVSGMGRWSSGCDHAEWAMIGVKVPDLSDAEYPERNYRPYTFMAHRSEYQIKDEWFSTGMRGTGSKTLVFDNLFIPNERLEALDALSLGYSHNDGAADNWIARSPFALVLSTFFPAVALGCADGMIEEFTKRQRVRKNAYTGAQSILNPAAYLRLAESVNELESISLFYRDTLDALQAQGEQGDKITEKMFLSTMSKLSFVVNRAIEVIDRLFNTAGASAMADFSVMQRYWRDAHTVRLHQAMDHDINSQNYGRFLMGLPPTPDL